MHLNKSLLLTHVDYLRNSESSIDKLLLRDHILHFPSHWPPDSEPVLSPVLHHVIFDTNEAKYLVNFILYVALFDRITCTFLITEMHHNKLSYKYYMMAYGLSINWSIWLVTSELGSHEVM